MRLCAALLACCCCCLVAGTQLVEEVVSAEELPGAQETEEVAPPLQIRTSPPDAPVVSSEELPGAQETEEVAPLLQIRTSPPDAPVVSSEELPGAQETEEVAPPLQIRTSPPDADGQLSETEADRETPSSRTAADWFRRGVDAYLSEDWAGCARAFENAVVEWQHFRRANVECRLRCGDEARRAPRLQREDVEHLHHAEEVVRTTLCILRCKKSAFRGHKTPDFMTAAEQRPFRELKPYEYLQLCYFQASNIQKAASAVFTILSNDPDNEMMKHNFKYYISMPDVDIKKIVNYESQKFVSFYLMGTEKYYKEEYKAAIINLERSLKEFFIAVEECRADCEGPFDQGWLPDFTSSVANHFVYCLKCKSKCLSKLSRLNGDNFGDLLPTHYHYLQFALFKSGQLEEACAAAATYLMFLPSDETMLENIQFYKSLPKVKDSMFKPRPVAELFIRRQTYEEALLKFIADEFIFEETENQEQTSESEETNGEERTSFPKRHAHQRRGPNIQMNSPLDFQSFELDLEAHQSHNSTFISEDKQESNDNQSINLPLKDKGDQQSHQLNDWSHDETEHLSRELGSTTSKNFLHILKESDMGGEKRFLIDGLADTTECQLLVQFAEASAVCGDGYDGNKFPHSPREKFEGVSLGRAALMVYYGLINIDTLKLFLNLSERGRNITADYFNILRTDLYFSYTHLVCRSAMPDKPWNASTLSHEIHADNCWLLQDGNCVRSDPAYFWRDFSAILYLNDNFEGGDFIFSADPSGKNVQVSIKPTCGRLVGFSSGRENLHGVRGIKHGKRCALALWFTLDPYHAEWGRLLTEEVLHQLEKRQIPQKKLIEHLESLVQFDLKEAQNQMHLTNP